MRWRAGGGPLGRRHRRFSAGDEAMQVEVLALVLRESPALLSFPLIADCLFENGSDFEAGYSLARAVRDLNVAGVLHSNGLFVMPSRTLLHLAHLGVI